MSLPTAQLVKGALIYFVGPALEPKAKVIEFQYNPESMTRTLTPWQPPQRVVAQLDEKGNLKNESELKAYGETLAKLSQPYDPNETFALTLELDATDALERMEPVALEVGIANQLAALEMLLYPPGDDAQSGTLGSERASVSVSKGGQIQGVDVQQLSRRDAPIVLFSWGPGRIVPVRLTSLGIEEQQFSPTLYPVRAKVTVGLRVLDADDLVQVTGDPATGAAAEFALACYNYTRSRKRALGNAAAGERAGLQQQLDAVGRRQT